jgi:hypothetical protein
MWAVKSTAAAIFVCERHRRRRCDTHKGACGGVVDQNGLLRSVRARREDDFVSTRRLSVVGLFLALAACGRRPRGAPRARSSATIGPVSVVDGGVAATPARDPTEAEDHTPDRILAVSEDRPADRLFGISEHYEGRHYLAGDEWNLQVFQPHVAGRGGAYLGVGSDQAYLFIGWSRPELAWLIDYDPWVVRLHAIYLRFFLAAATPEAFRRLWSVDGAVEARALLAQGLAEAQAASLVALYTQSRGAIERRLTRLCRRLGVASYLDDPAQYDTVRGLLRRGRVRALVADLLGSVALRSIAQTSRELGHPIRVLYLSNAEEYWTYARAFRENIRALPADERSVTLRTISSSYLNQDYLYNAQPLVDFQNVLNLPRVRKVREFVGLTEAERALPRPLIATHRGADELSAPRHAPRPARSRHQRASTR